MKRIFVTGSAGFIGFHLCSLLLDEGYIVAGYDSLSNYYDVNLKKDRHNLLINNNNFIAYIGKLEDQEYLNSVTSKFKPDIIIHLAAQAGVRYSLENPRAYIDTNIVGTFNVMECARELNISHLLMASTSSVYGSNTDMPYCETDKADNQLTIYAASKKANEAMAHSYAHLWNIPITMFRFFTVYGPWGRPDMAYFSFTKSILNDEKIDVFNNGEMYRDFTYVGDLVRAVRLLMDTPPKKPSADSVIEKDDSLSPVAPYRVINIGNSTKVHLLDFIEAIEISLGKKAVRNYLEMQKGDVPATWADASLLERLTGYKPETGVIEGISNFVEWYINYYKVK